MFTNRNHPVSHEIHSRSSLLDVNVRLERLAQRNIDRSLQKFPPSSRDLMSQPGQSMRKWEGMAIECSVFAPLFCEIWGDLSQLKTEPLDAMVIHTDNFRCLEACPVVSRNRCFRNSNVVRTVCHQTEYFLKQLIKNSGLPGESPNSIRLQGIASSRLTLGFRSRRSYRERY